MGIGDKGPLGRLHIRGEPGHDIIPELYPLPNEQIIDKPGRSAFQHTEFKLMLNIKGINNLILVESRRMFVLRVWITSASISCTPIMSDLSWDIQY